MLVYFGTDTLMSKQKLFISQEWSELLILQQVIHLLH
jgi:hypothetical protein